MTSLLVFLGLTGIWAPIAYAWWVKIRVMRLRQDLYDVRDQLFDVAADRKGSEDPAYVAARDHLNSVAAISADLSIPLLIFLISQSDGEEFVRPISKDAELQAAIDKMYRWSADRLSSYILKETLSGCFLRCVVTLFAVSVYLTKLSSRSIENWLRDGPFIGGSTPCMDAAVG
jgi:hypothetical protein